MIHTVRVANLGSDDPKGLGVLGEIRRLGITSIKNVRTVKVYRFEGLRTRQAFRLARRLTNPDQVFTVDNRLVRNSRAKVEVGYKPGVMNPEAESLRKLGRDCGYKVRAADSSWEYHFFGDSITRSDVDAAVDQLRLVNGTVQRIIRRKPKTLLIQGKTGKAKVIPIRSMSDNELMDMSQDKLFLNLEEMRVIQDHFAKEGRDPTDVELEILAQTWSEHCGHKTTNAKVMKGGVEKKPMIKRLMETAKQYFGDLVISAFKDNAGVMKFFEGWAICGKVETHNSPSAIEPYGGSMTGIVGVYRDPLGTGLGAKLIAGFNAFCFGSFRMLSKLLPPGCLPPDYLLRHVVGGVRDGANQVGVPTNNGSVYFHDDFRAKPVVLVGAYGILPESKAQKAYAKSGQVALVLGGRTGRDGIHGATFSSAAMTHRTMKVNSGAVQIGNPIEQKRVIDVIQVLRDLGLIKVITDDGAGGLASSVGELGAQTGVMVELERAPLKYSGLLPWEIIISESQERMTIGVDEEDLPQTLEVCAEWNVEATVIGRFTDDHKFTIYYHGELVCDLSMEFLHHGLPQRTMVANWTPIILPEPTLPVLSGQGFVETYRQVMGHLNVCSKERILRQYDHTVQGTCALEPFSGVHYDGPNDATVLRPIHGKPYGLVLAHGMDPILNRIDPYWGSIWASVEALSNFVAAGGDYHEACLIDNFIWPSCDKDEHAFGALDMAFDACCDVMDSFERPFISGKDSLGSTYIGPNGEIIKIPPVLCISVFGRIPDVRKTCSADFKRTDSVILLVGKMQPEALGGSIYHDTLGYVGNNLPKCDLKTQPKVFDIVHRLIVEGEALAVHDVSHGGMAATLAEMCFGGDCGADIRLDELPGGARTDELMFSQTAGCFLVEVPADSDKLEELLASGLVAKIGNTTPQKNIVVHNSGASFEVSVDELKAAWQAPLEEVFTDAE